LFLTGWQFLSTSNTLRLSLGLTIQPNVTSYRVSNSTNNNTTTFTFNSNGVMTTSVQLLRQCVVDSVTVLPVSFALIGQNPSLTLQVFLPYFTQTLQYDPDFSVALSGKSTDHSGGGSDLLPLLSLIALVIPIGMVCIVAVVLVVCFVRRKLTGPANHRNIRHIQFMTSIDMHNQIHPMVVATLLVFWVRRLHFC